ncbi:MAG TPA: hypothetical protein VHZ55_07945 [Bryobacteraceae bacterium]|jgi:uncharacterized protein|nr:hypothetical protein [Bryobacteraceae bacterium]
MSDKAFRRAIEEYIAREARPREKFGHQPRLCALAVQIGQGQSYDDDVVHAAAWFHDLGVFSGHRPESPSELERWDNTAYAMKCAPDILESLGFPATKIPAVVEAIRTHQAAEEPATTEGVILHDADILEQLGAVGVLRTVCKVGRDTRFETFTAAIRSLEVAVSKLPARIQTDTARVLAAPRVATLREFLAQVRREAGLLLH